MNVINFDTKATKLLQFLQDNYTDIPDKRLITGFTINVDVDDIVRITWRTFASLKERDASPRP